MSRDLIPTQPASTGSADQTSDARVSFPLKRSPPIAKQVQMHL